MAGCFLFPSDASILSTGGGSRTERGHVLESIEDQNRVQLRPLGAGTRERVHDEHRGAHDREGRGALRVDGRDVFNACTTTYRHQEYLLAQEVQAIDECAEESDPRFLSAYETASNLLERKSVFRREEFHDVLRDYLSLSIDDALASPHPVTRALAVVDRRVGKRRLRDFPFMADEHPVVMMLHNLRCEAEGMGSPPDPPS
ncbi:MAG: SF0329 family protein [Thermoleophilia bacterium]